MPRTVCLVGRVDSRATSKPGITGHLVTSADLLFQVHTINDFAAALCERAREQGREVVVIWKDGRFGKQLVQVELAEANEEAMRLAR